MAMIRLFLAGDVMTGRRIEQILHHPGESQILGSMLRFAAPLPLRADNNAGGSTEPLLAASRTLRRYEEKSNE